MRFDPRQSSSVGIVLLIVTIGGLLGALVMGNLVAESDFMKLGAILAGATGVGIILFLGRNVWLLIPLCWSLTGKIQILPIPLNVQELAVLAAFGFYVILLVFKKPLHRPKTGWVEFWLLVNLVWLVIVYIRNPVGLKAFNADILGGRPYFEVFVACLAFWVLTRTIIPAKQARLFPILMAVGGLAVSAIGILTTFFPRITPFVAPFYSGVDTSTYQNEVILGGQRSDEVGRFMMLKSYGGTLFGVLISLYRPFSLLNPLNVLPFILFLSTVAATFLSGFRSQLIGSGFCFIIACYFWGGAKDAFRAGFLAFAAVVLLVAAQSAGFALPKSAQRALSFLPGEWDHAATRDAEGSAEWRFDMWKTILDNRDKYLKNPVLGSGFGFPASELNLELSKFYSTGAQSNTTGYEFQLITGAFHNGPLSTVRFVGIIGLLFYYCLAVTMAFAACSLIKETKGTPFFYLTVFLAVPIVYSLFSFTFIFGGFDTALQGALFACAMLRCTSESLKQWSLARALRSESPVVSLMPASHSPAAGQKT